MNPMNEPPNFFGHPGDPVPPVDPQDLKTAYDIFQETARQHRGVATGVEVFRQACKPGADLPSVLYRVMMLEILLTIAKEQLVPWIRDGRPDAVLFQVISQLPMQWMETGAPREGLPFDLEELLQRLNKMRG